VFACAQFACGCVVGGGWHGGGTYEFDLSFADREDGGSPLRFVIFEETIHTDEHIDGTPRCRQLSAALRETELRTLSIPVPRLYISPRICIIPPLVSWTDQQFRFTVFAPGYRTVTVYPEGDYDGAYGELPPRSQQGSQMGTPDGPGILRGSSGGFFEATKDGTSHLAYERDKNGTIRCKIEMTPLTSKYNKSDAIEFDRFEVQITAVSVAIGASRLRSTSPKARGIVWDAAQTEHAALESANKHDEFFYQLLHGKCDAALARIAKWADGR